MTRFEYIRPHSSSGLISLGDADKVAGSLRRGSVAVLPTETGYMLAALATSIQAINRVFAVKARQAANVMHVACGSLQMAEAVGQLTPRALRILTRLTPGPVTVIVEKTSYLPDRLVTLNNTVGIRIPDHPATLQVITAVGAPLTATSLNASGSTPTLIRGSDLGHMDWPQDEAVLLVEDDDAIVHQVPSTLVRVTGADLEILRSGPISEAEIRKFDER